MMQIRMTQSLYQTIINDLNIPHSHAFERVGYVFVKPVGNDVLATIRYEPVPDEYYIKDKTVGARIDHRGIALAMRRADENNEGILLVHIHNVRGFPKFSKVDEADHPNFIRSFKNANPKMPHGFLLLSKDKMMARVWSPGVESPTDVFRYTIVGLPLTYNWFGGYRR